MLLVVSVEISALPENEEFLLISVNIRGIFCCLRGYVKTFKTCLHRKRGTKDRNNQRLRNSRLLMQFSLL